MFSFNEVSIDEVILTKLGLAIVTRVKKDTIVAVACKNAKKITIGINELYRLTKRNIIAGQLLESVNGYGIACEHAEKGRNQYIQIRLKGSNKKLLTPINAVTPINFRIFSGPISLNNVVLTYYGIGHIKEIREKNNKTLALVNYPWQPNKFFQNRVLNEKYINKIEYKED